MQYSKEFDLKRLQMMELEMAKVLLSVCDKYGLKIWADSGTLLGAVRHQGFIPWDDDMDFVMFRHDYDRLKEVVAKEVLPKPFYFEVRRTLIRIKYGGTTMFATNSKFPNEKGGGNGGDIWVDIICLDKLPSIDAEYRNKWKKMLDLDRVGNNKNTMTFAKSKGVASKFWHLYCLLRNTKKNERIIDDFCKESESLDCDTISKPALYLRMSKFRNVDKIHVFNSHWWDETVYLPFDGVEMPCPKDYDAVLKSMYGNNYMTPIQQSSVHGDVIVDLDRPYQEVVKELLSKYAWWKRFWYKY